MNNCLSLYFLKRFIYENLLNSLPTTHNSKGFLATIKQRYYVFSKSKARNLISELTILKCNNIVDVKDFIIKIVYIQSLFKTMRLRFLTNYISNHDLNFLFAHFSQIKTT